MAHWLFLPNDAFNDVRVLSGLSREKIGRLRALLDSPEFGPRYKFYVTVAETLGIADEAAANLCTFLNYVQVQRKKLDRSEEAVFDELLSYLKRHPRAEAEKGTIEKGLRDNRDDIVTLFSHLPKHEQSSKRHGLAGGPLPHIDEFRTYCDMRPIFDKDATNIVDVIPIITLHLLIHSEGSNETKDILVQLSESDVNNIKEQIDRLDRKLGQLRNRTLTEKK